jgi:MFS family permease
VVASFLGALPIGMVGLGVLLLVRTTTGSLAVAGVVSGALSIGNAVGLVVQGRLIDRYGQTRVLVASGVLCSATLVMFVAATTLHGPLLIGGLLAAGAGASIPATTSSMRVLWPQLVSDPALRTAAYTVLATQFQVAMVVGPLLVSALVVLASPAIAVLAAAGFAGSGGLLLAATPASRHSCRITAAPPAASRRWLGAGMYTLLGASFGGGVAAGMVTVTVPAVGAELRSTALPGLLFAALSAGELLGGLAYGGRAWRLPTAHRLVIGQTATAFGTAALALLTATPGGMLAAMFATGASGAPTSIASSTLLDDIAPAGSLARSYTVMVAVGLLGAAMGTICGGTLATSLGTRPVLLIAGSVLGTVGMWTLRRIRVWPA